MRNEKNLFSIFFNDRILGIEIFTSKLIIIVLVPNLRGANITGKFLMTTFLILYDQILVNYNISENKDEFNKIKEIRCRITYTIKCLATKKEPSTDEIKTCNIYLKSEINK